RTPEEEDRRPGLRAKTSVPLGRVSSSAVIARSRNRGAGGQAGPQPDHLVLPRQTGEAAQRGVDHRQARHLRTPGLPGLRGELLGLAEGLVQQTEGERLAINPAEVAARDRTGPRRPLEREDELLAVAVLEIAVVEPGVGAPEARRRAAARVVVVVRGEDEPGV